MFKVEPKCSSYDTLVKKQKTISVFQKIFIFVMVVSIALFVYFVSTNNYRNVYFLFLLLVTIIMCVILKKKFKKNNKEIYEIYCQYNGLWKEKSKLCTYMSDNMNCLSNLFVENVEDSKTVYAFIENDSIVFISKVFENILNCKKMNRTYTNYLNADFGKLKIPFANIDSYRFDSNFCTLIVSGDSNILRIKFANSVAFDYLIPQFEYYYSVAKKDNK